MQSQQSGIDNKKQIYGNGNKTRSHVVGEVVKIMEGRKSKVLYNLIDPINEKFPIGKKGHSVGNRCQDGNYKGNGKQHRGKNPYQSKLFLALVSKKGGKGKYKETEESANGYGCT